MSTKPDYEAAFHWIARHTDNNASITLDDMRQAVDAALVGFHPQPKGDER